MKKEVPPIEEIRTFTREVNIGDVIKSLAFENLLYKDIMEQDPMCGFYVNPYSESRSWDNQVGFIIEDPGRMKRADAKPRSAGQFINYREKIDPNREFIVMYKFLNCNFPKEQLEENEFTGTYPTTVIARMLAPDGSYDSFGIDITFNMNSTVVKNCVPVVEKVGFMHINYQRIF